MANHGAVATVVVTPLELPWCVGNRFLDAKSVGWEELFSDEGGVERNLEVKVFRRSRSTAG